MTTAEIRKKVGLRIKVRRTELELQQEQLGARLGLTQPQISGLESGKRVLPVEDLIALASALQTSVGYLVGEQPRVA